MYVVSINNNTTLPEQHTHRKQNNDLSITQLVAGKTSNLSIQQNNMFHHGLTTEKIPEANQ